MCFLEFYFILAIICGFNCEYAGHNKPFGSHQDPVGKLIELDDFPDPGTFFDDYVIDSQPFIVKKGATKIPAFKLWTDEYLKSKYGFLNVTAEIGKKEDRAENLINPTMSVYLDMYKNSDIYMVYDVPRIMMADDLIIPKSLRCGGFLRNLQLLVMWFSSGGTKSVLHSDSIDNINCLFDGELKSQVEDESNNWVKNGAYSKVDVERVDMNIYENFRNIPWWHAIMEKGDCLFIPKGWYHTVWSTGNRNLAVNFWFAHLLRFDDEDCNNNFIKDDTPLSKVYSDDPKSQRQRKLEEYRSSLFEPFIHAEVINETHFDEFMEEAKQYIKEPREYLNELLKICDTNHDSAIDWEEVFQCPIENIKNFELLFEDTEIKRDEL
ncbi:DgyrCDS13874 [Dimorphilus gyrociliatus]|uniref:DgyrCDS13874 n=1 Tax=Dimorphilus gyrociliatus TaxID=2664684 RepID=A0A7I8WBY3_9ANNE|nr:DgyrCDS13874 [Dimorphilus gyrociliatus]